MKIVLASASPRRKELLSLTGLKFEIITANTEEKIEENLPITSAIEKIALEKAEKVAEVISETALVIGADTIVCLDNEILGKPKDNSDAKKMLQKLSGKTHQVITAIAFVLIGENSKKIVSHQITEVKIKELINEEIDAYVASGEPLDKAGAYAIQGLGVLLTEGINGCYTNVVGLPVPLMAKILKKEFDLSILGD